MTCYLNDPPLMWYQPYTRRHPLLIGCTTCGWWIHPQPGARGYRKGWQGYEALFAEHASQAHGVISNYRTAKPRPPTPKPPRVVPDITDPADPRHGTYAGARAHYKTNTPPCDACVEAKRRYDREWKTGRIAA